MVAIATGENGLKKPPPESHGDRPTPRAQLPFRAFRDVNGQVQVECHNRLPDGQRAPFVCHVGEPGSPMDLQCYPIGQNVYALMKQFWEQEDRVDALAKKLDDVLTENSALKGQLTDAVKRADGMRAQAEGKRK